MSRVLQDQIILNFLKKYITKFLNNGTLGYLIFAYIWFKYSKMRYLEQGKFWCDHNIGQTICLNEKNKMPYNFFINDVIDIIIMRFKKITFLRMRAKNVLNMGYLICLNKDT